MKIQSQLCLNPISQASESRQVVNGINYDQSHNMRHINSSKEKHRVPRTDQTSIQIENQMVLSTYSLESCKEKKQRPQRNKDDLSFNFNNKVRGRTETAGFNMSREQNLVYNYHEQNLLEPVQLSSNFPLKHKSQPRKQQDFVRVKVIKGGQFFSKKMKINSPGSYNKYIKQSSFIKQYQSVQQQLNHKRANKLATVAQSVNKNKGLLPPLSNANEHDISTQEQIVSSTSKKVNQQQYLTNSTALSPPHGAQISFKNQKRQINSSNRITRVQIQQDLICGVESAKHSPRMIEAKKPDVKSHRNNNHPQYESVDHNMRNDTRVPSVLDQTKQII